MRTLCRALFLASALLLFAVPSLAISELSMFKCLDPTDADGDLQDYFFEFPLDTDSFEPGDCERLCKEVFKLCTKNVKSRVKCVKTDDKFFFKLQDALCEGDRECRAAVKAEQQNCKEQLSFAQEIGAENCVGLAFGCYDACLGGSVFGGGDF